MALPGKGKIIIFCLQMADSGSDMNNEHRSLPGGNQWILLDDLKNGLA
jgi:hypothetical protein